MPLHPDEPGVARKLGRLDRPVGAECAHPHSLSKLTQCLVVDRVHQAAALAQDPGQQGALLHFHLLKLVGVALGSVVTLDVPDERAPERDVGQLQATAYPQHRQPSCPRGLQPTVDNLLKPANKDELTKVLTYHVVPGTYTSADLKNGQKLKTVEGQDLTVSIKDGTVKVNDATVEKADIETSNGVVHIIDGVLVPPGN